MSFKVGTDSLAEDFLDTQKFIKELKDIIEKVKEGKI